MKSIDMLQLHNNPNFADFKSIDISNATMF